MRPFRYSHYYVGAFLLLTFWAFWPSYFAVFGEASFAHHLHGLTATLWIVLLMTQNIAIQHRKRQIHIWFGWSSLLLVPVFTAGGLLTTLVTLQSEGPFHDMFGVRLATADLIGSFLFCTFFALALRHRRDVQRHSRYMLATVTLLIGPSFARLLSNNIPPFKIETFAELPKFGQAADASLVFTIVFLLTLVLWDIRNCKPAVPFTLALVGNVVMYHGYYTWARSESWYQAADLLATLPAWLVCLVGLLMGIVASLYGWQAGKPRHASSRDKIRVSVPAE